MDGDDVTADTLKVLAGKLVQNQAKMNALTAQKEELQSSLETVKAKFASLENPSELIAAIRVLPPDTDDNSSVCLLHFDLFHSSISPTQFHPELQSDRTVMEYGLEFEDGWFLSGALLIGQKESETRF